MMRDPNKHENVQHLAVELANAKHAAVMLSPIYVCAPDYGRKEFDDAPEAQRRIKCYEQMLQEGLVSHPEFESMKAEAMGLRVKRLVMR